MEKITRTRGEQITMATSRGFATIRGIPPGFNTLDLEAVSSTIESILVAFGPRIVKVYFYDASRTGAARWIDYSKEATDRNTLSLVNLSVMQTDDRLYVGATMQHEGWSVDVVGTNGAGTASGVWEYPLGSAWTSLSATQTGIRGTAVFDQDGLVTWTVPTTNGWQAKALGDVADEATPPPETERLYWTRCRVDAAITDTSVTLAELTALFNDAINTLTSENEGEDDIRIVSNNGTKPPYRFPLDTSKYGSVELVSATLTSAANLNWLALR